MILRFGVFEADTKSKELFKRGRKVRIQPLAFKLLVLLLEHKGSVVTTEEIKKHLWHDTHVEPHSLAVAALKVRRAIGEHADSPRFMECLPGVGYRWIAYHND